MRFAPRDLYSTLLQRRVVHLNVPISAPIVELLVAELLWLQHESSSRPIQLYLDSPGSSYDGAPLGAELQGLAIYDALRSLSCPVSTCAVGRAHGEAALLLAAGTPGRRSALPSASIGLRRPKLRLRRAPAADLETWRGELVRASAAGDRLLAGHCALTEAEVRDFCIAETYLDAYEAQQRGIVDQVLDPKGGREIRDVWEMDQALRGPNQDDDVPLEWRQALEGAGAT